MARTWGSLARWAFRCLISTISPLGFVSRWEFFARRFPTVRLTWTTNSSETYLLLKYSTDMVTLDHDAGDNLTLANDDEVPGDADQLTLTVDLSEFDLESEKRLYFRVRR